MSSKRTIDFRKKNKSFLGFLYFLTLTATQAFRFLQISVSAKNIIIFIPDFFTLGNEWKGKWICMNSFQFWSKKIAGCLLPKFRIKIYSYFTCFLSETLIK